MAASTLALALAAAALLGVVVLCLVLAVALRAERRRATTLLATLADVTARVDALAAPASAAPAVRHQPEAASFVITDIGTATEPLVAAPVPDRVVLSATLGEPLVRGLAVAHGLRRALSAESRNRIRFEMRREMRRSRRRRKQEMKDAWRQVRAESAG
ncbi:MAG: hypothetical protein ACTHJH_11935 [Marmoricola sp.]